MTDYSAEMWDHLAEVTADYTAIELNITPSKILPFTPYLPQIQHQMDNGSFTTIDTGSLYYIGRIQWDYLTASNHGIIFNLYSDPLKANLLGRSIYWVHPVDGHSYTMFFHSKLTSNYVFGGTYLQINPVDIRIVGRKPA